MKKTDHGTETCASYGRGSVAQQLALYTKAEVHSWREAVKRRHVAIRPSFGMVNRYIGDCLQPCSIDSRTKILRRLKDDKVVCILVELAAAHH